MGSISRFCTTRKSRSTTLSDRPSWDAWALGIADAVATRGDCTRSKVGAVLLDRKRRVCMSGYNGTVAGEKGCLTGFCPRGRHYRKPCDHGYCNCDETTCACGVTWPCPSAAVPGSDYGNCISIHAEENLLIQARREDLDGGTVYVTRAPCYRCLPRLKAAGVFRVVWRTETDYEAKVLDWGKSPC